MLLARAHERRSHFTPRARDTAMATLRATGANLAGCASRVGVRRAAWATRPPARGTATVAPRDATRHLTTRAPRAAEMMGVPLYPDDLLEVRAIPLSRDADPYPR